jgi:hypothetical protein
MDNERRSTMDDFLTRIDWTMLKDQKNSLQRTIRMLEDGGGDAEMDDADALVGLLHLIDALQDTADDMGMLPDGALLTEGADD